MYLYQKAVIVMTLVSLFKHQKPNLNQAHKYKTTFVACQKLATLASEVSMTKYQSRLEVLHHLAELWEMDKDARVVGIEDEVLV